MWRRSVVGLLLASAGLPAIAGADTVTIADDRTTTVRTGTEGAPTELTFTSDASVDVDAGAALVIDTNTIVTNDGALGSADANDTTGVLIEEGVVGGFTNTGSVALTEEPDIDDADVDDDGDDDTSFAYGSNRIGVLARRMTGSLNNTSEGTITVEGNQSFGILVAGALNGNIVQDGTVFVLGDDARGLSIAAPVSGGLANGGATTAYGKNAVAIDIADDIGGAFTISGSVLSTGYRSTARSTADSVLTALDADDLFQSGSAVRIAADVAGGFHIQGVGYEFDDDDDGDGTTDEEGDDTTGSVTTYSGAPAIDIGGSSALTLGAGASGYGFYNQGRISGYGVYDGVAATGVRIGAGTSITTIEGGLRNDGAIVAGAQEASATGLALESAASAQEIRNEGSISASVVSDIATKAVAIDIAAGASVSTLINRGSITSAHAGELGDGIGIRVASNALTRIENSGYIAGSVSATEDDDGNVDTITGASIAIDASAMTSGLTLSQASGVARTDSDTTDDSSEPTSAIEGDVRFGSGADQFLVSGGAVTGNVSFGAGDDVFTLSGGAFEGTLSDSDGRLTLSVANADLFLTSGETRLTSAHFHSGGNLIVGVTQSDSARLVASGAVTFDQGARIRAELDTLLDGDVTHTIVEAGSLSVDPSVLQTIGVDAPYLYAYGVGVAANDPNALELTLRLKSAAELGLNDNETAAYGAAIDALIADEATSVALANLYDADAFQEAYSSLLPTAFSATSVLTATAFEQFESAALRHAGLIAGDGESAVWAQEFGFGATRENADKSKAWHGNGFGFATGLEGPTGEGGRLGLSIGFLSSAAEPEQSSENRGTSWSVAGALTRTTEIAGVDLRGQATIGGGKSNIRRTIAIDSEGSENDVSRTAQAGWTHAVGAATFEASRSFEIPFVTLTPRLRSRYAALWEDGYEETGADGLGLSVSQRTWEQATGEALLDVRFDRFVLSPELSLGWRERIINDTSSIEARFVGGDTRFVLNDDPMGDSGLTVGLGLGASAYRSGVAFRYDGAFFEDQQTHGASIELRLKF